MSYGKCLKCGAPDGAHECIVEGLSQHIEGIRPSPPPPQDGAEADKAADKFSNEIDRWFDDRVMNKEFRWELDNLARAYKAAIAELNALSADYGNLLKQSNGHEIRADEAEAALAEANRQREEMRTIILDILKIIDSKEFLDVFGFYAIHGMAYNGPYIDRQKISEVLAGLTS